MGNMTIKKQNNNGAIRKVCHLHNVIFDLIHLSVLLFYFPCVIQKK